jgi:hypothetical protein
MLALRYVNCSRAMTDKDISDADYDSGEEIDSDLEENNVLTKLFEFTRD